MMINDIMRSVFNFIDNLEHVLIQVLKDTLVQSKKLSLNVVTAFFNLKGLGALDPELEALEHLRLLLGKEQDQSLVVDEQPLVELFERPHEASCIRTRKSGENQSQSWLLGGEIVGFDR